MHLFHDFYADLVFYADLAYTQLRDGHPWIALFTVLIWGVSVICKTLTWLIFNPLPTLIGCVSLPFVVHLINRLIGAWRWLRMGIDDRCPTCGWWHWNKDPQRAYSESARPNVVFIDGYRPEADYHEWQCKKCGTWLRPQTRQSCKFPPHTDERDQAIAESKTPDPWKKPDAQWKPVCGIQNARLYPIGDIRNRFPNGDPTSHEYVARTNGWPDVRGIPGVEVSPLSADPRFYSWLSGEAHVPVAQTRRWGWHNYRELIRRAILHGWDPTDPILITEPGPKCLMGTMQVTPTPLQKARGAVLKMTDKQLGSLNLDYEFTDTTNTKHT